MSLMVTCTKCYNEHHDECMGKTGMFDCDCKCFKQSEIASLNIWVQLELEYMFKLEKYHCSCKKCFCPNAVFGSNDNVCAECSYGIHEGPKKIVIY